MKCGLKLEVIKVAHHLRCHFKLSILLSQTVKNSTVFALFEAPDSVYNLHIALDKYKDVITDLQASMWKSVKIKCLHYCNV